MVTQTLCQFDLSDDSGWVATGDTDFQKQMQRATDCCWFVLDLHFVVFEMAKKIKKSGKEQAEPPKMERPFVYGHLAVVVVLVINPVKHTEHGSPL